MFGDDDKLESFRPQISDIMRLVMFRRLVSFRFLVCDTRLLVIILEVPLCVRMFVLYVRSKTLIESQK